MNEWFLGLSVLEKIYWVSAIFSTIIFFAQFVLSMMGAHTDMDIHTDFEASGTDLDVLSFRSIVAFFMMFGWTGIVTITKGLSLGISLVISIIAGGIGIFIIMILFRLVYKLNDSGNVELSSILNQNAKVYLTIPPKGKGTGKIQVSVGGSIREYHAITNLDKEIKTSEIIKIVKIINNNSVLVEKF